MLLCPNHHRLIDDDPTTYSVERLLKIKQDHEEWVRSRLAPIQAAQQGYSVFNMFRADTGACLTDTIGGAHASHLDNDPPNTEVEAELVGEFLQGLHDYIDVWSDIQVSHRISAQFELTKQIELLRHRGWLVYKARRRKVLAPKGMAGETTFDIAYVWAARTDNPMVKRKDGELEQIMRKSTQIESEFSCFITAIEPKTSAISFI